MKSVHKQVWIRVENKVREPARVQVRDQVWYQVHNQVSHEISS